MLKEIAEQNSWVIECLNKNGVKIPENPSNGDIYFAMNLYKIEVFHNQEFANSVSIRKDGKLIGVWLDNFKLVDQGDGKFTYETKYWINEE